MNSCIHQSYLALGILDSEEKRRINRPRTKQHIDMTKKLEAFQNFLQHQTGWTLLLALSHVLFWTFGYPTMKEYGYSDRQGPTGAYVSGQYGSGIVPVTLTFVIIFSIIWIVKVATALRFALAKDS